jgi:hypothetical protein
MLCLDGDEQQNPVGVRRYCLKKNHYHRDTVFKLLSKMMYLEGNEWHNPIGIRRYHLEEQYLSLLTSLYLSCLTRLHSRGVAKKPLH